MKIRQIKIANFRGIKKFEWALPENRIYCLIGKGDSTKSTVLDAIRYAFHANWNLAFFDSDFYSCNTQNPIEIEVVIGELSDEFCSQKKFGSYMRGWNNRTRSLNDEPEDGDEEVLSVKLLVESDLEPSWKIVTDRTPEGVDFKAADRAKVGVGMIGNLNELQLTWARGTILAQATDQSNLNGSLVEATRAARNSLEAQRQVLSKFDEVATKSQKAAQNLGVPVSDKYKAHLDLSAINIRMGGLTLHDGEMPLRLLGLGSRRMLLCGIQQAALENNHITLFDELEYGLEPHRISRLVRHIKDDSTGQYFLTTHSPTVLRELTVDNLYILRKEDHEVMVIPAAGEDLKNLNIQGNIRLRAEAFLSKKIIVCEGATEVGFMRGLDHLWSTTKMPFSYQGVVLLDAGGASKVDGFARAFKKLNYEVMVLADGDAQENFSDATAAALEKDGIPVAMWADHLSLEQRAMIDLPWDTLKKCLGLAVELGYKVRAQTVSKFGAGLAEDFNTWAETLELRKAIGTAAKDCSWFKDISRGELWGELVFEVLSLPAIQHTDLAKKVRQIRAWVDQ